MDYMNFVTKGLPILNEISEISFRFVKLAFRLLSHDSCDDDLKANVLTWQCCTTGHGGTGTGGVDASLLDYPWVHAAYMLHTLYLSKHAAAFTRLCPCRQHLRG